MAGPASADAGDVAGEALTLPYLEPDRPYRAPQSDAARGSDPCRRSGPDWSDPCRRSGPDWSDHHRLRDGAWPDEERLWSTSRETAWRAGLRGEGAASSTCEISGSATSGVSSSVGEPQDAPAAGQGFEAGISASGTS